MAARTGRPYNLQVLSTNGERKLPGSANNPTGSKALSSELGTEDKGNQSFGALTTKPKVDGRKRKRDPMETAKRRVDARASQAEKTEVKRAMKEAGKVRAQREKNQVTPEAGSPETGKNITHLAIPFPCTRAVCFVEFISFRFSLSPGEGGPHQPNTSTWYTTIRIQLNNEIQFALAPK